MKFINCHTHTFSNATSVLEIVNQYPSTFNALIPYFSVGIHPWKISEYELKNDLQILKQKIQLSNCLALGECGLDKRIETAIDLQLYVFEKQIKLAQKYNKPLLIHCVAAFQELIAILHQNKISVPVVIHGFSKNEQIAKQLVTNGFYLSFGKYLLQNLDLQDVFKSIPNDKFFLETDSSSYKIQDVYKVATQIKSVDLPTLQNQIKINFKTIFKI